jgi:hypothetical protein
MKKLYVFATIFLFTVGLASGQTMKRVMYEGFTSANCPPCVPNNAAIRPILAVNPTKVVALKYHTHWPGGADFANIQTQTWASPRINYYGVTSVPTTRVNGTGAALNQGVINQQYTNTSPFFLEVNHTFNPDSTQIEVEVKIKAAQDYTGTQLVLHLAMVEKLITFASAPGANGEREFNDVMRRMYPNASGTSLANAWINEQEQVLNFTVDVPAYIYRKDQIAFVVFIQSNATKQVLQAAKSIKDFDGALISNNLNKEPLCGDDFEIEFSFINSGKNTLTSFDVVYGVEGKNDNVYNWTGSHIPGETKTVTLPDLPLSDVEKVFVSISNPNGNENAEVLSFNGVAAIYGQNSFVGLSYEENFSANNFPPKGWVTSSTGTIHTWHRHTANGGSARIELHRTFNGQEDNLYTKPIDLTENGSFSISFKVAHAMINSSTHGPNDRLMVQLSKDCGQTWTTVFSKTGSNLATVPNEGQYIFVPTAASQWREEVVDISEFSGESNVIVRFNVRSGVGNCLYIDDVKLEATGYLVFMEVEGTGGSITAMLNGNPLESGANIPPGSEVVFTAHPHDNYLIDHWQVNGEVIEGHNELQTTISDIHSLQDVKVAFRVDNTNIETIVQNNIKVFPIPAKTMLNIVSEELIEGLVLLNLAGQEVYSATAVGLNHTIDVRNLKAGVYVLRINTHKGMVSQKILVE